MDSRQTENLSDYIRRVRAERGLSTADVEKKSGFTVTDGYVSHIENGIVSNVTPEKLRALAKGLGVSEDEIFAVARGVSLKPLAPSDFGTALQAMGVEHFQRHGGIENLSDEDRAEIAAMIETMIEQKLIRKAKTAVKGKGKR